MCLTMAFQLTGQLSMHPIRGLWICLFSTPGFQIPRTTVVLLLQVHLLTEIPPSNITVYLPLCHPTTTCKTNSASSNKIFLAHTQTSDHHQLPTWATTTPAFSRLDSLLHGISINIHL